MHSHTQEEVHCDVRALLALAFLRARWNHCNAKNRQLLCMHTCTMPQRSERPSATQDVTGANLVTSDCDATSKDQRQEFKLRNKLLQGW
jgi:hypothetical protein